jgi:hypothetical protein
MCMKPESRVNIYHHMIVCYCFVVFGLSFNMAISGNSRYFDVPRTSLWRLVRQLEGLELVEIKRIGLENEVHLKK